MLSRILVLRARELRAGFIQWISVPEPVVKDILWRISKEEVVGGQTVVSREAGRPP